MRLGTERLAHALLSSGSATRCWLVGSASQATPSQLQPVLSAATARAALTTAAAKAEDESSSSGFPFGAVALFLPSALCGALTYWQLERKRWKDDLIERRRHALQSAPKDVFQADDLHEYDMVSARGTLVHSKSLFVGPRPRSIPGQGVQSGYLLITPLVSANRQGVVLVNRGWVPAAWRRELPAAARVAGTVDVWGAVQPNEQPSQFVQRNDAAEADFHYIDVPAMAGALGLPADTPLVMSVTTDPAAAHTQTKSPLQAMRAEPLDGPMQFPIPKNVTDLTRFTTMPNDHLIYAGTWAALCVSLALMARHAVTQPHRMYKLVGNDSAFHHVHKRQVPH